MKVEAGGFSKRGISYRSPAFADIGRCALRICCDGGADEYIRNGHTPNLIIGDGDSISEENRKKYGHLLHRIAEQETNDQTKAVNYLLSQGKRRIAIVGATGKREDHTLGNISLLMDYMRAGADVRTYTDHGIFIPCRNTCTFTCQPGQQVSIINFNARKLHGLGLVYPLSDFTNWWQALSTNASEQSYDCRRKGVSGFFEFPSATSTKYTLIQIIAMATACVQLNRSCPKESETTVVTTNIR